MAEQFFWYWNSLTKKLTADRMAKLEVRVYQNWPVRKVRMNPDGSEACKHLVMFQGEPCRFGATTDTNWQTDWLQRFGSGKFTVFVNELGVVDAICSCELEINDPEFPPKVAPEDISLAHPNNKDYIQEQRDAGIRFPGDEDQEAEEQEMVAQQVNTELVGKVVEQAADIGEMKATISHLADRAKERAAEPPPVQPEVNPVVSRAYDTALDMVKDTAREQREALGKGLDINQVVQAVKTITEMSRPADNGFATLLADQNKMLQQELMESRRDRERHLEEENRFLRDRLTTPTQIAVSTPAPSNQPRSVLDEIKAAKELLDTINGGGGADKEPSEPWWTKLLSPQTFDIAGKLILGATSILGMYAANIGYNQAVARTGQGTPQAPPQPVAPQPQPQGPPPDPNVSQALAAGVPPQAVQFLQQITEPLTLEFLQPNGSGYGFAEWVLAQGGTDFTAQGRQDYIALRNIGYENLLNMLRAWAPIWNVLGSVPLAKVEKFIREFLSYDEWQASQAAAEARPMQIAKQ